MGALSAKLESAHRTQEMSQQISKSVPLLKNAMKQMDSVGAQGSIGDFEKVFEDLDVKTGDMNEALNSVYSTSIDNGEVMNLLTQMKDEQTMEAGGQINAGAGQIAQPTGVAANANEVDAMQAKLNELKNL